MPSKTKTFRVPTGIAADFARKIKEYNLPCELMDANKNDDQVYEVDYKSNQLYQINELIELIDDYLDQEENEEEYEEESQD